MSSELLTLGQFESSTKHILKTTITTTLSSPMPLQTARSDWEFEPVYDFLRAFGPRANRSQKDWSSPSPARSRTHDRPKSGEVEGESNHEAEGEHASLGDFSKIYKSLGLPQQAPVLAIPTFEASTAIRNQDQEVYASDGALYYPPSTKPPSWGGKVNETQEHADTAPEDEPTTCLSQKERTRLKNRRKKENKKQNKIKRACNQQAERSDTTDLPLPSSVLDASKQSDTDSDISEIPNVDGAAARICVDSPIHDGVEKSKDVLTLRPIQVTPKAAPTKTAKAARSELKASSALAVTPNPKFAETPETVPRESVGATHESIIDPSRNTAGVATMKNKTHQASNIEALKHQATDAVQQSMQTPAAPSGPITRSRSEKSSGQSKDVAATPTAEKKAKKAPQQATQGSTKKSGRDSANGSSGQPNKNAAATAAAEKQPNKPDDQPKNPITPSSIQSPQEVRKRKDRALTPLMNQSKTERNWSLLLKLLHNFPDDKDHILAALQLSINRPQPQGIHVFVDASNILIGYVQHLKLARGISRLAHLPTVYPSFHSLALLLERRRSVAKRVLVGSTPEVAAYEEAREVGYETSVLDKVWKVKELTERQKFFARYGHFGKNGKNGYISDGESSKAEMPLPPQKPKWHEQAVDEVIHMKMMESLLDTTVRDDAPDNKPTEPFNRPTMVLATGDAAEAEYGSGFLKMVQRALAKGWYVEVACWGHSLSKEYQRLETSKKGARFKIIKLDNYAEELFPERPTNGGGP
ncbi:MAG: hypothetical protein M1831_001162 [Alyxoria varia]|nr:MAG: hypothetical protein M1831_001162 [Alyxoria varia]